MEKPSNEVIMTKLDSLYTLLEERFDRNESGHNQIIEHQKRTNGKVKENSEFRISLTAQISLIRFLIGFLGFSTIAQIVYLVSTH